MKWASATATPGGGGLMRKQTKKQVIQPTLVCLAAACDRSSDVFPSNPLLFRPWLARTGPVGESRWE